MVPSKRWAMNEAPTICPVSVSTEPDPHAWMDPQVPYQVMKIHAYSVYRHIQNRGVIISSHTNIRSIGYHLSEKLRKPPAIDACPLANKCMVPCQVWLPRRRLQLTDVDVGNLRWNLPLQLIAERETHGVPPSALLVYWRVLRPNICTIAKWVYN